MHVAAIQCPVRMDVKSNVRDLEAAVSAVTPNTLVVAPEGLLSGYLPERGFVKHVDEAATLWAIQETQALAARANAYIVAGACVRADGAWRNSAFCFAPDGRRWRYDKINLAQSERDDFAPGSRLPVIEMQLEGRIVRLGVQMCREIRYPEQWRCLATRGAEIIAFVNNAVGSLDGYELWRAHVVSRAAEVQRFIVGANNAAPDQKCTTLVVAPSGRVLIEAPVGETSTVVADIDLTEVSDWVISQARTDVVTVTAVNS
jgi:predicted amidohydrolase